MIQMKRGAYIRVIPLRTSPKPAIDFVNGEPKPRSTPPFLHGHYLEGYLAEDIVQSARIRFEPHHLRDGQVVEEPWRSSRICCVMGDHVFCERAKYRMLKVPPFDAEQSLRAWL